MSPKFEVYRDKSGLFRFHLVDAQGSRVLFSESYKEKRSAFVGIASVKKNCSDRTKYVVKNSIDGRKYFLLKAANHEAISRSEFFSNIDDCNAALDSVMGIALYAETQDTTRRYKKREAA